jgi:hypothetical protein
MRFLIVILAALSGVPASLSAAPALPFDPATLHGFNLMEKVAVDWMNAPYREEDFALIKEFGFNYVRLPVQPAVNAFLYGPFWKKDDLNRPLVLRGSFPAQTLLDVRVLIVSTSATLVVKADGKPVFEKRFEPKEGVGEWAQAVYAPKWRIYQNVYNHVYTIVLPVAAKEISLELTDGDWLRFTELGLTLPGRDRQVLPGDSTPRRTQQPYDLSPDGALISPPDFDGLAPLAGIFAPLREVKAAGGAVFMGEFGCYSKTPHDVMLAYTQSLLERCKADGIGWAMWNFRGEFGVLDSNRSDVAYEAFKGHKLDRKLMDILKRCAAP